MRLLAAGASVLAGVALAALWTRRYIQRERTLRHFTIALAALENRICFYALPLSEAFRGLQGPLEPFFEALSQGLEQGEELPVLWREGLGGEAGRCLTQEDQRALLDFAALLGRGDIQAQERLFSGTNRELERLCGEARAEKEKNVRIYRVLGFVAGIVTGIVIV